MYYNLQERPWVAHFKGRDFLITQLARVEESVFKYFRETRRHPVQMRHLGNRCVVSMFHSQIRTFPSQEIQGCNIN